MAIQPTSSLANAHRAKLGEFDPQRLGPHVDAHDCTDDDGGSVSTLVRSAARRC